MIQDDEGLWIDSSVTRYVCKDKNLFKKIEPVEESMMLYMGNSLTVVVKAKESIDIIFISEKILTLNDVYYIPEIRKNLVSGGLLNKFGFKLVFEAFPLKI